MFPVVCVYWGETLSRDISRLKMCNECDLNKKNIDLAVGVDFFGGKAHSVDCNRREKFVVTYKTNM